MTESSNSSSESFQHRNNDLTEKQVKIRRRRAQMLVHSFLYYGMDSPIVSDHAFDTWARELADLQSEEDGNIGFYDEVFKDWSGGTGMHLPKDGWIVSKATHLLQYHDYLMFKANNGK